jgi:Tol biopolymer transport system component
MLTGCAGSMSVATQTPVVGVAPSQAAASLTAALTPTPAPEPWIAHAAHAPNGVVGIHLLRPDGFHEAWILLDVQAAGLNRPDWSPDGSRLAFERFTDPDWTSGAIWTAAADGSGAREFAACPGTPCQSLGMPAWSPDGTAIAVVRSDVAADGVTAGSSAIEVIDVASGDPRTVAVTRDGRSSLANPRWSPDGRSIVLEVDRYASAKQDVLTGSAIAIVKADAATSADPRLITRYEDFGSHPDWSSDRGLIVFGSYDIDAFAKGGTGPSNLFIVGVDGVGPTAVTDFPLGGSRAGQASWTPDGSRIIFTKVDGTDFDGLGARHPTFINIDGSNLDELYDLGTFARLQPLP